MKRSLLLLLVLLCTQAKSQQPLSKSLRSGAYTYIYSITADEAKELYRSDLKDVSDKHLHSLTDSFQKDEMPRLAAGNYLLIQAVENQMQYELFTEGDLQMKIVSNNRDLLVLLHDKVGAVIADAEVQIGKKKMLFDTQTKTYRLDKWKRSGVLLVNHSGTLYYFPVKHTLRKSWTARVIDRIINIFPIGPIRRKISTGEFREDDYVDYFDDPLRYEKKHRSFFTYNKPIYKPGDTVKLKAFVLKKNGKGIQKKLLVRLTDEQFFIDTIIGVIDPYRRGGYTFDFVLNDSLDLDLDDEYLITLEEERSRKYDLETYEGDLDEEDYVLKRKVVAKKMFRFEEYELESITFSARTDKKTHSRGDPVSLFLKATDENNLPVMDGRVEITLVPSSSGVIRFDQERLFLPDTLWRHSQVLDAVGETKITIPDSVYPSAIFNYSVQCVFLNTNNERQTQTLQVKFDDNANEFVFNIVADSLRVEYNVQGRSVAANASIYALNDDDDTLQKFAVILPATVPLSHYATYYEVETKDDFETFDLQRNKRKVSAQAARTKDSVFISLNNPHRMPVWYTVFAGDKPVARGQQDSLFLTLRSTTEKNYFLSLQYLFGNRLYTENYTIPYQDKLMNLAIQGPSVITPGETTAFEVTATDHEGKPVADADITAWSFTRKFKETRSVFVPYLGKIYPGRKMGYHFWRDEETDWTRKMTLNFERWSREMGLDTIEYYRFLYPEVTYSNTEQAVDSITQIAPYVVINGKLQPVHILYIDEKPHFFSHAQHLQRYSFQVTPGRHSLRIRTHDRMISVKEIDVPKGVKTIFSFNADSSTSGIIVQRQPDTLSLQERVLISKYSILINNNFGEHLGYIQQDSRHFLLPSSQGYMRGYPVMVGPLMPDWAELNVKDKFRQVFEVEGNYLYDIREGLIRQKELPGHMRPAKWLTGHTVLRDFKDLVLTADEIDSLWIDYIDSRSKEQDLFYNAVIKSATTGRLAIRIPDTAKALVFIKNIFLFRHDNPDFLNVYRGDSRDLGYLPEGLYRLFVLLRNDRYLLLDSISVKKGGTNYFNISSADIHKRDSVSIKLSDIIRKRELALKYNPEGLDEIKKSFHSAYLDSAFLTGAVTGQLRDAVGRPIPGASVIIKGTRIGTTTDHNGYYQLRIPENARLVFSSVGYSTVELPAYQAGVVVMLTDESDLNEVVVTVPYGIRRSSKELSYSTSVVTQGEQFLMGRVSGLNMPRGNLNVRGIGSVNGADKPLIVLDGVPFDGELSSLEGSAFANVQVLTSDVGVALYGSRATNGVILITTGKGILKDDGMNEGADTKNSIRRNFRDDAFWQPTLRTDSEGKVRFSTTFPDDITSWKTFVVGMGGNKLTGYTEGSVRSFRPVSANLSLPQFTVAGDRIHFISKSLNYGSDSVLVRRKISFNGSMLKEGMIYIKNSVIDTSDVVIPSDDSVRFQVEIEKPDGYFDGEERVLPVYPQGVLETKGVFLALDGDTTISIQLDPALGKVTLHAEASLFPVLLDETERIHRYEYLCNEQLASKLKALLSQKKISGLLGEKFRNEKAVEQIIGKLLSSRSGLLWGWWPNNQFSPWISLHVVEALLQAQKEGYSVGLSRQPLIDQLVFNMESYRGTEKLLSLHLLHQLGAKADFKKYTDSLSTSVSGMSLYEKLRLMELKQKVGLETGVDSLVRDSRQTMFGNLYWGEEGFHFFDNSIHNTILMYRILRSQGGNEIVLKKIRNYFLEKRKNGEWRNTYESSLILETILPDLLKEGKQPEASSFTISTMPGETIRRFPFHQEVAGGDTIRLDKKGELPVYFTAHQSTWIPNPSKVSGSFSVSSVFQRSGDTVGILKAGEPVVMEIRVSVQGDADYVMIEIPIPAGCSYKEKLQPKANNEVHREYFKNKVSIFCSTLRKGTYTFYVSLQPRYSGTYHLNPAKAEMMYFPVFYGREGMKKVEIR